MWETTSLLKKSVLFFISITLLLALLVVAGWANPIIDIADPKLEAYVRSRLDRPRGPIYLSDALVISKIDIPDSQVESLKGLEHFSKLTVINLENNQISDLSYLADLSQLADLNLRNNDVKEIGPLKDIGSMRKLDLYGNQVEDISALEQLRNLESLNLRENNVQDLKPLAYLNKLKYLNLHSNTRIISIQPLALLAKLEELILRNVPVGEEITYISNLNALQRLNLRNTQISDVSVLADLMSKGALQDRAEAGLQAEVNLLENDGLVDYYNDPASVLRSYWHNISYRYPVNLPYIISSLSDPELSREGGFYKEGFWLEITHEDPDAEIYYTLDGSEPTPSSTRYNEPIWIDGREGDGNYFSLIRTAENWEEPEGDIYKGNVVRATAALDNNQSHTVTSTYFVDPSGADRYSMPVISIAADERNLFDPDFGIYTIANADNTGLKWERPAHLEFYENDGRLGFSQNIGLRIQGGATRTYRQKSLRVYARLEYDEKDIFHYEVFPGHRKSGSSEPLDTYQTLILRNAGNDWYGTMLRDGFMQSLVEDFDRIETQAYRPAIVFINGEYWGIHGIRERYDSDYFANHFDCEPDAFAILSGNASLKNGSESDSRDYLDIRNFISIEDMSLQKNYEYVKKHIDIDSLIQYYTANIYFGNRDWPENNIDYWRMRAEFVDDDHPFHDGRWRWLLYDTDFGFGRYGEVAGSTFDAFRELYGPTSGVDFNTLAWATAPINYRYGSTWPNMLINGLLDNNEFRHAFINYMADQLNTIFAEEAVKLSLYQIAGVISPEIEEHISRWQTMGRSVSVWNKRIDAMAEYAEQRPSHVRQHYVGYFRLSGISNITVHVKDFEGITKINSINIDEDTPGTDETGKWTGTYFRDVPVTIIAIPNEGYSFVRWEGVDESISQEQILEIYLKEDIVITPIFQAN